MPPNPRDYGLPHDDWRKGQFGAYHWLTMQDGYVFLQAPTGTGKTALARAMASDVSVTSLVKTKNLQAVNYGQMYGFDVLFGRGNYPCSHPLGASLTASDCLYSEVGMHRCDHSQECEYLVAKEMVRESGCASLNYSYWLTAKWPRKNPPHTLFLDEGDEVPDVITDWASCTVTRKDQMDWGLPVFPMVMSSDDRDSIEMAIHWLGQCRGIMQTHWRRYEKDGSERGRKAKRKIERLGMKVKATLDALQLSCADWYIRSGPRARPVGQRMEPGFIAKPLTARYHFPDYFGMAERVVLMSATIGNPEPLAFELGIDEYRHKEMTHPYAPEDRAVYIPEDVPKIGAKAEESAYEKQADLVADSIKDLDPSWFGVVLVTSKYEAGKVAERLARRGLQDRVWCLPEKEGYRRIGTERQTELWELEKRKRAGAILVSWTHWRGWDGLDEKICCVMKTPFPRVGGRGSFEREKMMYNGKLYHWRTGNMLEQGTGRTRRGRPEDYGPENGFVGVFDANWKRVRNYLSESWKEAVVH